MMLEEVAQSSLKERIMEALCTLIRRWKERRHLEGTVIVVLSRPKFRNQRAFLWFSETNEAAEDLLGKTCPSLSFWLNESRSRWSEVVIGYHPASSREGRTKLSGIRRSMSEIFLHASRNVGDFRTRFSEISFYVPLRVRYVVS
jgi:hypothetical protein